MRGLGTIINALAIVIGGVLGILFKRFLKERYQDTIIKATGFSVVFLGAAGTLSKILTVRPDGTLNTGGSSDGDFMNRNLKRGCDYMKNNSPQKQAAISWIILMIGILLAVIGAMTAKEYRVNLCLLIGAMVVVGGIVYHLTMMKCPYCGCSLVGYRPIPKECPKCHKKFEE